MKELGGQDRQPRRGAKETRPPKRARVRANLYNRIAGFCARHAVMVLAAYVLLAAGAVGITASKLEIDTDPGRMISAELPFRKAFADYTRAFPSIDNIFLVVVDADDAELAREAARSLAQSFKAKPEHFTDVYAPGTSRFFDDYGILFLSTKEVAELSADIERAGPMFRILSAQPNLSGLSNLIAQIAQGARRGAAPSSMGGFLREAANAVEGEIADRPQPLDWENLGENRQRITETRWFVFAKPMLDYSALDPAEAALAEARRIVADPEINRSGRVKMTLTGEATVNAEEFETVTNGALLAGLLSLTLVSLVISFGMPAIRLIVPALSLIFIGFLLNAGFATLAVGHLNMISVAFAVLFIGLGIDYAVHMVLRYAELARAGADTVSAIRQAAHHAGPALGLCTLTTSLAFLAFTPTDFAGMAQLGIIAAGGIVIAFAASLTLIPAVLNLVPLPFGFRRQVDFHNRDGGAARLPFLRKVATVVVLVLAAGSLLLVPSVRFDGDPINLKDPAAPSVVAFRDLLKSDPGKGYAAQILVESRQAAIVMASALEALGTVKSVRTVESFLPEDQPRKLTALQPLEDVVPGKVNLELDIGEKARRDSLKRLVSDLKHIADAEGASAELRDASLLLRDSLIRLDGTGAVDDEMLKRLENALFVKLPGMLQRLSRLAGMQSLTLETIDKTIRSRYIASDGRWRLEVVPAGDLRDTEELNKFVREVRSVAANATGTPVEITGAAQVVASAMGIATLAALGLVVLVLLPILRKLREVLLVLAPIVLASLLLIGYTVIFNSPFNFANVIVLPLLLGLGVDSSIHYVMRAREGRGTNVMRTSTPRAVLISALTTIGSFGTLWLSDHRGMASMGELLTVTILFTLVCTLVVLPQLISWSRRDTKAA